MVYVLVRHIFDNACDRQYDDFLGVFVDAEGAKADAAVDSLAFLAWYPTARMHTWQANDEYERPRYIVIGLVPQ